MSRRSIIALLCVLGTLGVAFCVLTGKAYKEWRSVRDVLGQERHSYSYMTRFAKSHGFLSDRSNGMQYYGEAVLLLRKKGIPLDLDGFHQCVKAMEADPVPITDLFLRGARSQHIGTKSFIKKARQPSGQERLVFDPNWAFGSHNQISHTELMTLSAVIATMAEHLAEAGQTERAMELGAAIIALGIQYSQPDSFLADSFISLGLNTVGRVNGRHPDPEVTVAIERMWKEARPEKTRDSGAV
jgi:hypothetical protein